MATRLKKSVEELLASMSSWELSEWFELLLIEKEEEDERKKKAEDEARINGRR